MASPSGFSGDFEAGDNQSSRCSSPLPRSSSSFKVWWSWMVVLLLIGVACFVMVSGFLVYQLSTSRSFLGVDSGKTGVVTNRWSLIERQKKTFSCAHRKQGKSMIVDDKGWVCSRKMVDRTTGCCRENTLLSCAQCRPFFSPEKSTIISGNTGSIELFELINQNSGERGGKGEEREEEGLENDGEDPLFHCCDEFEVCVSCCLASDGGDGVLVELGTTKFEECMAMCRTNSCSVVHQKVYLLPKTKHCYGDVTQVPAAHYQRHQVHHQPCRKLGS